MKAACRLAVEKGPHRDRLRADRPEWGANLLGLAEARTFRAERLAASSGAQVLPLDVVASIALSVVVVDTRKD
jgi:hypothetical protein